MIRRARGKSVCRSFSVRNTHNLFPVRAPKAPLVFCHGLLGFDSVTIGPAIAPLQVPHWRGIKEVLEDNGCEVLITRVPATSSPVDRAKVLEKKISETYPGRAVHLIGVLFLVYLFRPSTNLCTSGHSMVRSPSVFRAVS